MLCSSILRHGNVSGPRLTGVVIGLVLTLVLGGLVVGPPNRELNSPPEKHTSTGKQLYAVHCAACHGEAGDGDGPAARFLYPRPRNFADAKFRIATTVNSMPTDEDLLRVISRGMPGSAMFPFGHLNEADRKKLVAYIRELTLSSFVASAKRDAEKAGEKIDLAELAKDAAEVLKPGDAVAIPAKWPEANEASINRGKASYLKTCAACHGATGKGDGVQEQKNVDGTPTAPRDFTRGIFKGGREREQLYVRIALGMAGTPMPATTDATPEDIADMVNFIQSLSSPDSQSFVEHKRNTLTARRTESLPAVLPNSVWASATPTRIVVTPLWWRNYAEPDLRVQALHDGQTVALRLSWRDDSRDDRISRPEDFEDMAAVQLFDGAVEPFLGMGAADASVDLWLWRATWQKPRDYSDSQLDDYPFDTPFYRDRLKAKGKAIPDFQTARAAGNPHARGEGDAQSSSLGAKGFGSTTFRPRTSQVVRAQSSWVNGAWTVEFRRPMAVEAGQGLALASGSRYSLAFSIWDGAARDRNGQKLVSIWHDLKFE